jgi:acyl-CoA dehydrogenase
MATDFLGPAHRALASLAARTLEDLEPGEPLAEAELARKVAALGFYPYLVPRTFGGALEGVEIVSLCVLREELAYRSPAADGVFAVQGLGSHPVLLAGSPELQRDLLPRVSRGEVLFAFALTEPEAGSDVAAVASRAERAGNDYLLTGHKRFISNAGIATHVTVFARTGQGPGGLSAFVVPVGSPGLRVSGPMELLGEHSIGALEFDRCRVPASSRLGDEGAGMKLALATLDVFRTTVGAAAVGMGRRAMDEAVAYARSRRQFGAPLADLVAVQHLLADSAVELEASRLLVHRAAAVKDSGQARVTYEAAVAKLFATEAAQRIVDRCLQVHGGNGLLKGSPMERLYRNVRALRIYEGASDVQRLLIARQILKT